MVNGSARDIKARHFMRGGSLFVVAAIVIFAGLLLPISPTAIDVLVPVNLIFTAMLITVVFLARKPVDIISVPLVVISITLLRLGTNIGAAKCILLFASAGNIVNWCGERMYYGFTSVVVTVILVFLICVLICKSVNFVRRKAASYLVETIPNRQAALDAEFKLGTVTQEDMLHVRDHIERQKRFFEGMASMSLLLLCDCILILIITVATTFGATALGIVNASAAMAGSPQYFPPALAIAMITAIPAALVALAIQILMNKKFLIALKVQVPPSQAVYVPSSVVEPRATQYDIITAHSSENAGKTKLQTVQEPDAMITEFTGQPHVQEPIDVSVSTVVASKQAKAVEPETITQRPEKAAAVTFAEFSEDIPNTETRTSSEQTASHEIIRDGNYYDSILATAWDKDKAVILLIGQNVMQLPVTVAVELALNIIEVSKKCLLIDMDPVRQAVAAAFDIDSASMQAKAVPTEIENLWITPASENGQNINLVRKVAKALQIFDYVVIYAPNASMVSVQQQLTEIEGTAVIFGADTEQNSLAEFIKLLNLHGCRTVSEQDFCVRAMNTAN